MCALLCLCLSCGATPETEVLVRGSWVFDRNGEAVEPTLWMRGLQPSDLTFSGGKLLSVGDQRSNFAGHLFTIAPPESTPRDAAQPPARLSHRPVGIVPDPSLAGPVLEAYLAKRNPDFEGLAHDPFRAHIYYGVIEMDGPFLLEIHWPPGASEATIKRIAEIEIAGVAPWRDDLNYRFEGVAVVGPGPELVVAFERAQDGLPRLLRLTWRPEDRSNSVKAEVLPIPFDQVSKRPGKGLLNVNGIAAVCGGGREIHSCPDARLAARHLLLIARDQERILVVDLEAQSIVRIVNIDFRGPEGERLMWVSPEGIAVDAEGGRVFVISDPDSMSGNFRRLADAEAQGNYGRLVPLLFTIPLMEVAPELAGKGSK